MSIREEQTRTCRFKDPRRNYRLHRARYTSSLVFPQPKLSNKANRVPSPATYLQILYKTETIPSPLARIQLSHIVTVLIFQPIPTLQSLVPELLTMDPNQPYPPHSNQPYPPHDPNAPYPPPGEVRSIASLPTFYGDLYSLAIVRGLIKLVQRFDYGRFKNCGRFVLMRFV